MLIDCDSCTARGARCAECVVTVLLAPPRGAIAWDADERRALRILAEAGLVPGPGRVEAAVLDQSPRRQRRAG